jgi:hypothetical protein
MLFQKVRPPPCVCGVLPSKWELSSGKAYSRMYIDQYWCPDCGRPGFHLMHEGGTAFASPKNRINGWPSDGYNYVSEGFITAFGANADDLVRRRDGVERAHLLYCLKLLGHQREVNIRSLNWFSVSETGVSHGFLFQTNTRKVRRAVTRSIPIYVGVFFIVLLVPSAVIKKRGLWPLLDYPAPYRHRAVSFANRRSRSAMRTGTLKSDCA